ncbi:MAG: hypothetical protein KKA81_16275 [Bacteroidetes bacterium]|nr:hypothetical protein [Bacteroidota bacterium]
MAETTKNTPDPESGATAPAPTAAKSGLIKYIIFGLAGVIAIAGIAFGTLMFLGGDKPTAITPTEPTDQQHAETTPADKPLTDEEVLDSLLAASEGDSGVIDAIMGNLAVLDYEPDESELVGQGHGMSAEDSLEAADWLETEKKRLTFREDSLNIREKKLNRQELQINQKILQIEQAESARVVNLARLYDGMDSRAVARLMSNLDDNTVVAIIPRMKAKNAAAVLQLLPAQRAANLSKQMITIAEK